MPKNDPIGAPMDTGSRIFFKSDNVGKTFLIFVTFAAAPPPRVISENYRPIVELQRDQ